MVRESESFTFPFSFCDRIDEVKSMITVRKVKIIVNDMFESGEKK